MASKSAPPRTPKRVLEVSTASAKAVNVGMLCSCSCQTNTETAAINLKTMAA
jgi:hypothetical protein